MNEELKHIREEIHAKLMAYPTRDPEVVEASWKYTGLAGGHRAYLGDEQASTLMALSFGGSGIAVQGSGGLG